MTDPQLETSFAAMSAGVVARLDARERVALIERVYDARASGFPDVRQATSVAQLKHRLAGLQLLIAAATTKKKRVWHHKMERALLQHKLVLYRASKKVRETVPLKQTMKTLRATEVTLHDRHHDARVKRAHTLLLMHLMLCEKDNDAIEAMLT